MMPFLLMLAFCHVLLSNAQNTLKANQMLITQALMTNYDRINRPVINDSDPVMVQLQPSLFSILEVNIAEQTLSLKQWYNMYWNDPNLSWDPDEYGGVDTIMLQRDKIWLPDIVIVGQTSVKAIPDKLSIAQITSDGNVSYASDQVATIACQFDVIDYPYDTQNCSIRYSSWMYSSTQIIPYPQLPPDLTVFNENDEWTMRSYTARSGESTDIGTTYVDLYYDIKITRKPSYYITTFIWPSFLITCLSIIGVFSPFNESGKREEKVTMGLTTLLTMAVILMIITGDMPKSSNGIPLLGLFIMMEIGIASIATVISVFIIYLHSHWMTGTPVPHWLLQMTCLAKKKRKTSNFSDTHSNSPKYSDASYRSEQPWIYNETKRESRADPKLFVTITKGMETLNLNLNVSEHRHEALREEYSRVAHRIDLILMIIFLIANALICVGVMTVGNSKLDK